MTVTQPASPASPPTTRVVTARHVLILLLTYAAVLSGALTWMDDRGIREPQWMSVTTSIVFSLLCFWWYWLDAGVRRYRRTPLLNVAVIGIAVIAIPWYVIRSRPRGEKLRALGRLVGYVGLVIAASVVGAVPAMLMA